MKFHYVLAFTAFMGLSTLLIAMPKPAMEPASPKPVAQSGTPTQAPIIARVGQEGVEPPVFTKRVSPEYPKRAIKIKLQGFVILEAILRKTGEVDDVHVLRGLGKGKFGFEESAITALKKWEFQPGKVDGVPSDVRMTLKIDFVLHQNEDLNISLSDWFVGDGQKEGYKSPSVKVESDYETAMDAYSTISIPVQAQIDVDGAVIQFELDPEYLAQLAYPGVIRENVTQALEYYKFTPASVEETTHETQVVFNIKVPLKSIDLHSELKRRKGK